MSMYTVTIYFDIVRDEGTDQLRVFEMYCIST